jgi:hypothetical protein
MLITSICVNYVYYRYNSNIITVDNNHSFYNIITDNKFVLPVHKKEVKFWSVDFHISPIADAKWILKRFNVHVIDKSLSSHCHLTNTCASDLQIIDKNNGINLGSCPNQLRRNFYEVYRSDKEFLSVDAMICNHATSICELYMPFNKSLIVIASTRYVLFSQHIDIVLFV